jgi:hypothetical protein
MASKYTISTVFKGVDRMTRPVRKMGASISKMTESAEVGLRKVDAATEKVTSSLFSAGKKAAIGLGVITTAAIAGSTAINKQTVETQKLIKAQEMSAETVEAITHALKGSGLGAENVLDLAEEMRNAFGESAGLEEITKVTESLGIMGLQFRDIKKLSPEDQFKKITDTLLNMESATEAASAADILFGAEGNKIVGLLREQDKSLGGVVDEYRKLNFFTDKGRDGASKYVKELSKTETIFGSIGKEISGLIGLHLSPLIGKFNDFLVANKEVIQIGLDDFFEVLAEKIGSFSEHADQASTFILNLGANFEKFITYAKWIGIAVASFTGLSIALKVVTGLVTVFNLAMAANPIVWVIAGVVAAITGLGFAVKYIYQNWGSVSSWFSDMWESIKTTFNIGVEFIKSAFSWSPLGMIIENWSGITDYFASLFGGITDMYQSTVGAVMSKVNAAKDFFSFGDDNEDIKRSMTVDANTVVTPQERISRSISENKETFDINVYGQGGAKVQSDNYSSRLNLINTGN